MIRGGHINLSVLGALEVAENGDLANWMVPGKMVKGMGGAMDLVAGVRRVVVVMEHNSKDGAAKFKPRCELPLTGANCVDMLITDLAVFERPDRKSPFRLIELAPGVTAGEVRAKTSAGVLGLKAAQPAGWPVLRVAARHRRHAGVVSRHPRLDLSRSGRTTSGRAA